MAGPKVAPRPGDGEPHRVLSRMADPTGLLSSVGGAKQPAVGSDQQTTVGWVDAKTVYVTDWFARDWRRGGAVLPHRP